MHDGIQWKSALWHTGIKCMVRDRGAVHGVIQYRMYQQPYVCNETVRLKLYIRAIYNLWENLLHNSQDNKHIADWHDMSSNNNSIR